jgi:hypothetical protein
MTRKQWIALTWMLSCCGLSALWGFSLVRAPADLMIDFKGVFYDARCLFQHADPYEVGEPLRVYLADGGPEPEPTDWGPRQALALDTNLPTTSVFIAPFAMLPWGTAQLLWTILTVGSLIVAAFLMWNLGANYAPLLSGTLICFVLANTEIFFPCGNTAGIVISLCMVAVWCFLRERFVWAGILCLAVSLAIKPHDAGFVWLYFLLAGKVHRKRALQTLLIAAVLGLAAIAWVTPIAPHWMQELHSNIAAHQLPGGVDNPGLANATNRGPIIIIDLQSTVSVFRNDPRIYNSVSYLVCGTLLLVWAIRALRSRFSQTSAWFALAAVVPFTLLVTYHRPYDAKLLMLAVPACAMLWAKCGSTRWLALLVTSAGFAFTGDMSLTILDLHTKNLHISTAELSGQLLTVVLTRPTQLALLAMGIFYLWIYMRYEPERAQP